MPQPNSNDPIEQASRAIFESFPPGLQRALESGSLDRVNEVLGKMSVEEAEEVVGQLGEGNMLSMEEGVIDGTTEEGKQKLRQLEESRRHEHEHEQAHRAELAEDAPADEDIPIEDPE